MKNFNEVYEKIYNEVDKEGLKVAQRKNFLTIFSVFGTIFGIIIMFIFFPIIAYTLILILAGALILFLVISFTSVKKEKPKSPPIVKNPTLAYEDLFKREVITKLVSYSGEDLTFNPKGSISRELYEEGGFNSYDNYDSEDLIYGTLDNSITVNIADTTVEDEYTDSDGNTSAHLMFQGLFCVFDLPQSINSSLKIRLDKKNGTHPKSDTLIKMDSREFDKIFNVYSKDKIMALRILTSDIMDYMLRFREDNKQDFDFSIIDNRAYIRLHTDNLFEGPVLGDVLDFNLLFNFYKKIEFAITLCVKINDIISIKEI